MTTPWFQQYQAAVDAAASLATAEWSAIRNLGADEEPLDATMTVQLRLRRWQVSHFGFNSDERLALGVIEELGETFNSETLDDACDGLGDVVVYVGQLAFNNQMTIGPILDLGRVFQASQLEPLRAAGYLAHTVLKHVQAIRGLGPIEVYRSHLVACLGLAIAKATDDVELVHGTTVNVREVYRLVGEHVLSRRGNMVPTAPEWADRVEQSAAADRRLAGSGPDGLETDAEFRERITGARP